VPFTLAQITYSQSWQNGTATYTGTFGDDHTSFTMFGIGIGVDGQVYTSDNANTPIVAAYCRGYGYNYDAPGFSLTQALSIVSGQMPDTFGTEYYLNGVGTGSLINQMIAPVPEPSQMVLTFAGICSFSLLHFRKKK
jgi:hypothetical protein